mmetsp:Transcript_3717/g.8016  ORF Transcript_3717/g.8016 Transcript_3717/m.8016 type:complete len:265 (+) Transcript_3717:31-825(+)
MAEYLGCCILFVNLLINIKIAQFTFSHSSVDHHFVVVVITAVIHNLLRRLIQVRPKRPQNILVLHRFGPFFQLRHTPHGQGVRSHLSLDGGPDQGVGRLEQLVVFATLIDEGLRIHIVGRRAGKEFEQSAHHHLDILRHQQSGPIARVFRRQAPLSQLLVDAGSEDWHIADWSRSQAAQRQVQGVFAFQMSQFVTENGLNFGRGAAFQQCRGDDDNGWGVPIQKRQRVGIGLRIALQVQIGSGVKIQNAAGLHHGLVQFGQLLG